MQDLLVDLGYCLLFCLTGAGTGIVLLLLAVRLVPGILNRMTSTMDEEAEIARGNRAVAEYFGRLVAAVIIGLALVISASVVAGVIAALH